MSGYSDEPRDFDDPDRRGGERDRRDEDDVRAARQRVSVPAVGLIVVGALTIFSAVSGLVQLGLGMIDRGFDDAIQKVQADPNIPAGQKQDQVQVMNDIRDSIKTFGPPFYATGILVGVIIIAGGLRMRVLGSPGLSIVSSLLAMVPFSPCCVLGLVFGIWALVALANPDVKAGFAAKRRLGTSPDSY
ncbi:MAG: hypothetical protein J0I06_03045 [Planctomycetes bacterium]|nr:hypothetical protein [Planctomycetota bacterium]